MAVSSAARCPTFFFAADDEDLDLGCNTEQGSLVSLSCRFESVLAQYSDGKMSVTPLRFLEDEDEEGLEELLDNVGSLSDISLLKPKEIAGGKIFYESPVAQWPGEAGDLAKILGLGTWDPLLNLERDFSVVFEHLTP